MARRAEDGDVPSSFGAACVSTSSMQMLHVELPSSPTVLSGSDGMRGW
jgi:hypothetical protein